MVVARLTMRYSAVMAEIEATVPRYDYACRQNYEERVARPDVPVSE